MVSASPVPFQGWEGGTESKKQGVCGFGNGAKSKTRAPSCPEKKRKENVKDPRKDGGEIKLRQLQ